MFFFNLQFHNIVRLFLNPKGINEKDNKSKKFSKNRQIKNDWEKNCVKIYISVERNLTRGLWKWYKQSWKTNIWRIPNCIEKYQINFKFWTFKYVVCRIHKTIHFHRKHLVESWIGRKLNWTDRFYKKKLNLNEQKIKSLAQLQ